MQPRLAFGPFVFDRASATLSRGDNLVPLGGRAAALLAALLEADNGVVTKAALMECAWPDHIVEEGNLAVQIATLRKALGTRADGGEWIATVARVGYRLVRDSGGEATGRPSFAVLPFVNMSSDPEQQHFADGMVEDLITAFSRFRTFTVVARQSSQAYRGSAKDMREIARELSVRYLLEGSVRREGRHVRVTVQLIDGQSGLHLWAEKLDGTIDDVFAFQDRVTTSVVGVIEPQIRYAEIERARTKPPENFDAYDLYLRALPKMTGARIVRLEDIDEAIELLHKAIELDPDYAAALALCAWAHERRYTRGGVAPPGVDDASEAMALSERALGLDPNDAVVVMIAGVVLMTIKDDTESGLARIKQAAALNPNSMIIVNVAGWAHTHLQDYDEAIAWHLRALQLGVDLAESHWTLSGLARAYLSAGRVEEALVWGLRGLEVHPGLDFTHCIVAASYALLGRMDEARKALDVALAIWPGLTIGKLLVWPEAHEVQDRLLAEGLRQAGLPA
jgi:TolB-like protein